MTGAGSALKKAIAQLEQRMLDPAITAEQLETLSEQAAKASATLACIADNADLPERSSFHLPKFDSCAQRLVSWSAPWFACLLARVLDEQASLSAQLLLHTTTGKRGDLSLAEHMLTWCHSAQPAHSASDLIDMVCNEDNGQAAVTADEMVKPRNHAVICKAFAQQNEA